MPLCRLQFIASLAETKKAPFYAQAKLKHVDGPRGPRDGAAEEGFYAGLIDGNKKKHLFSL
jgi:hypothetical protein